MRIWSKNVSIATLVLAAWAGTASAVPITGPNGGIQSASTTAIFHSINGGCIGPGAANCSIDGNITGNPGTFLEFFITGGETFTYTLSGLFDISQFLLWNDRLAPDSGIAGFTLVFHGSSGPTMFSGAALPFRGNNPTPEVFNVGLHAGVSSIDLIVNTGHNRNVQFREIEFDGVASVPEPATVGLMLIGLICVAGIRRWRHWTFLHDRPKRADRSARLVLAPAK